MCTYYMWTLYLYEVLEPVLIEIRTVLSYGEETVIVKDYKNLYGVMQMPFVLNGEEGAWVYLCQNSSNTTLNICLCHQKEMNTLKKNIEKKKRNRAASKSTPVRDHLILICISMSENSIQQRKRMTTKLQLGGTQSHCQVCFFLRLNHTAGSCWAYH